MRVPSGHPSSDLLDQYIRAGLPESEALRLEQHLEDCSECRCRKQVMEFWAELNWDQ